MQERAQNNPKIAFIWDSAGKKSTAIRKQAASPALNSRISKPERPRIFKCDGLFVAIGHDPTASSLSDN
jgi:thioredoxin reductase